METPYAAVHEPGCDPKRSPRSKSHGETAALLFNLRDTRLGNDVVILLDLIGDELLGLIRRKI